MGLLKFLPVLLGTAIFALEAYAPFATAAPVAAAVQAEKGLKLLMVRRDGCVYCNAWEAEIAPGYAKNPLGQRAPLIRVDVKGPYPDGLVLDRKPWVTPTFILLNDGQEIERYEGYPGKDRFYAVLTQMIDAPF